MIDEASIKIQFPCEYPVKVVGRNDDGYRDEILEIIRTHAPDLIEESIDYRASSNGKYLSVKVTIRATGVDQLQAMFDDLKASGRVEIVL